MKRVFLILLPILFLQYSFSQTTKNPGINAGEDIFLGCDTCTVLNAVLLDTQSIITYVVTEIPFEPEFPFNSGIVITQDDMWSDVIDLPFDFWFFDGVYNQVAIGSNGVVTFDVNLANDYCDWAFNDSLPSADLFKNTIFGAYHDIYPSVDGNIYYDDVNAESPGYAFVINYDNVSHYSCIDLTTTQQIVLYEFENVIEINIKEKPVCESANNGNALLGIQDKTGTNAVWPPGYNTGPWSADSIAFRFTPVVVSVLEVNWYKEDSLIGAGLTIDICNSITTTYTAELVCLTSVGDTIYVSDEVTVFVDTTLIADAGQDTTICPNETVTLGGDPVACNGTEPYFYYWYPPGEVSDPDVPDPTASPDTTTTYFIIVTDSEGTTAVDSLTITVEPFLNIEITGDISCFGDCDGAGSVNITGGVAPFDYIWSDGSTSSINENLCVGATYLTVTDNTGCDVTGYVIITQPDSLILNLISTDASCYGYADGSASVSVSGGTVPYTYTWNNGGNTHDIYNLTGEETYFVTVTDNNGCYGTDSVFIDQPDEITANTSATESTCGNNDGTATVYPSGGTPGYTYLWDDSGQQTSQTAVNLYAGFYHITVTDTAGCTVIAIAAVHDIVNGEVIISDSTEASCFGYCDGSVVVNADGGTLPYFYLWSDGQTDSIATNLCAGIYYVTVTDADGCKFLEDVIITEPDPVEITASNDTAINSGNSIDLEAFVTGGTPPYTINWISSNNDEYSGSPITVSPASTTTYYVYADDVNGCFSDSTDVTVHILDNIPVPIDQEFRYKLYPNPYKDEITIDYVLTKHGKVNIVVYDILGIKIKTIINERQKAGKYVENFSGKSSAIAPGVYYVVLNFNYNIYIEKIINISN